ncbi:MAG: 4Fe-4S dicluster domain-containing protein [Elusimicrobia bacterium]|nr:4Fe-4S dicluster domain-containing protein [Elusimicrobiota bacterium]
MSSSAVDARLGLLTYKNDHESHISIKNQDVCANQCKDKPCVALCPAAVYTWDDVKKNTKVQYENCIECGGCRMICPYLNIDCHWPRGGFGVAYKYG